MKFSPKREIQCRNGHLFRRNGHFEVHMANSRVKERGLIACFQIGATHRAVLVLSIPEFLYPRFCSQRQE